MCFGWICKGGQIIHQAFLWTYMHTFMQSCQLMQAEINSSELDSHIMPDLFSSRCNIFDLTSLGIDIQVTFEGELLSCHWCSKLNIQLIIVQRLLRKRLKSLLYFAAL